MGIISKVPVFVEKSPRRRDCCHITGEGAQHLARFVDVVSAFRHRLLRYRDDVHRRFAL